MNNLRYAFLCALIVSSLTVFGQSTSAGNSSSTPSEVPTTNRSAPSPVRGFSQPGGTFNYSLTASETIIDGYAGNGGTSYFTNFGGNAALVTDSETHPTSLMYAGGYLYSRSSNQPSSVYQNLGISQALATKHWNFTLSDFVSYLPSSPTTGLSGIAGVGDINSPPTGPYLGQNLLTYYATRITNSASASADAKITAATSLQISGSHQIQRFLGSVGIDNTQISGSIGPQHRLDALSTIGGNYSYSRYTYGSDPLNRTANFSFISQGINLQYQRTFSRKLAGSFSIGPQWTSSSASVPSSTQLNVAAQAALNYTGENTQYSLSYYRGSNSGSGVLAGANSDDVGFVVQRAISRNWSGSLTANYARTSGLFIPNGISQPTTDTFFGGGQLSRRLGRYFSIYANYTAQEQSIANQGVAINAFNGLSQIVGFGVTFAPSAIHFGRH